MKKHNNAFTLVEIMITVAIIALLTTLGTIGYMRARQVHNEAMVKKSLKVIYEGVQSYWLMNDTFPDNLAVLGPNYSNPPYIDEQLASGAKNRYWFYLHRSHAGTGVYMFTPPTTSIRGEDWACQAIPYAPSGKRAFAIKSSGEITEFLYP